MPKHAKYPTTGSSTGTRISGPNAYVSNATFSSWTFGDANSAAGDLATQTSSSPRNFIIQISPRNSDFTSKIQIFAHELRQSLTVFRLLFEHPSVQFSVSCQTPFALIFAFVIWDYGIFRISGLLGVTNGLDPLEE
ncbi:hypothetical protein F511_44766 [Dorcoceras hygrometricum]|uniref:Uncharacterized protein n=1 Tax=Dorcoceras hygrometricum TaxID=472368 RepID=A0A2Z7AUH3_9LAMI|nr:hypothetical protein F511_44766 [Dorcoceras hygrometricum]